MRETAQDVAGAALGIAGVGLVGYLLYREWQKSRLVDEFMEKIKRYEAAYRTAIDRGDHEGAASISETYEKLMREEEEMIKAAGALETLIDRLTTLGIVVSVGIIAVSVVRWIIRKYPPPRFPCGTCGKSFPSDHALDTHIRTDHSFQPDRVPQAQIDYSTLSDFWKNVLEAFSGVPRRVLEQDWRRIAPWALIAVAIAAAIVAFSIWGAALAGATGAAKALKSIALMIRWVPVPA